MARLSTRDRQLLKDMAEIRDLLKEFGVQLSGYDPGVTGYFINARERGLPTQGRGYWGESLSLDRGMWNWLRPLLEELRTCRMEIRAAGRCKKDECKNYGEPFTESHWHGEERPWFLDLLIQIPPLPFKDAVPQVGPAKRGKNQPVHVRSKKTLYETFGKPR